MKNCLETFIYLDNLAGVKVKKTNSSKVIDFGKKISGGDIERSSF